MKKGISLLLFCFCWACVKENKKIVQTQAIVVINKKTEPLSKTELRSWPALDILSDTIPGVSFLKTKETLIKNKKGAPVVIALLDMPVAITHDELKQYIWVNPGEIPNNRKDDDNNGYVDDINGWNFLGNMEGENMVFMNYSYTRILKSLESDEKIKAYWNDSTIVNKAKKAYEERMAYAKKSIASIKRADSTYKKNTSEIQKFIKKELTISILDSLAAAKSNDTLLVNAIQTHKLYLEDEVDDAYLGELMLKSQKRIDVLLNMSYDERAILGDVVENLEDTNYGNGNVSHNLNLMDHGTLMAGILASNFGYETLNNVIENIQIMPVCISGFGDENDKDIALAIRYAVDNGADIINISSGKSFSLRQHWITDAIQYAAKNDVLIVKSSGNSGFDLDEIQFFPNDILYPSKDEVSDNFVVVGSSNYMLDKSFVHPQTNYGVKNVDIFAPGEEIYTTSAKKEKFTSTSGTSASAAIFSKAAAILKSYFPDLKAKELKDILLTSGVEYNMEISMKDREDAEIKIAFTKMSKSGKVVNLKNAFELASELSH